MGGLEQKSPVYVSRIIAGGVAARDGKLRRGDILLSVNGIVINNLDYLSFGGLCFFFRVLKVNRMKRQLIC